MNSAQRDHQTKLLLYPPEDIPLLAWFEGVHDAVLVAFHPFFRLERAVVEPWEVRSVPKGELVSRVPGYPNDPEMLANAQRVRWMDIAAGAGLHGVRAVNYALLTWIRALKPDLEDRQGEQALRSFLKSPLGQNL